MSDDRMVPPPTNLHPGEALRAGDAAGLEELYRLHGQHLYDFLARLTRSAALAEDLTQTTLLRAWERRTTLRDPSRARAWLFSIAYNAARDHLSQRRTQSLDDVGEITSAAAGPEDEILRQSAERLVWDAASSLEPRQRAVIDLSIRHDLDTREIASVVGVSVPHAAVLVNRARAAMRHAIRSLVLVRDIVRCEQLARLVPVDTNVLTAAQRRTVEHHQRHCARCTARATELTSPFEMVRGIALLPLPGALGKRAIDHIRQAGPTAGGSPTAVVVPRGRVSSLLQHRAAIATVATLLVIGGGTTTIAIERGRSAQPSTIGGGVVATSATATPVAVGRWTDAQDLIRNASAYHVHYGLSAVPDVTTHGTDPIAFDLDVVRGEFSGSVTLVNGFIGRFDVLRSGGTLYVRRLNLVGNLGVPGAPMDAFQFFGIDPQVGRALGDAWLPLSGGGQQPAATLIDAALSPYASATRLADEILAPPGSAATLSATPSLGDGSVRLEAAGRALVFRVSPDPFVQLYRKPVEIRIDKLGDPVSISLPGAVATPH